MCRQGLQIAAVASIDSSARRNMMKHIRKWHVIAGFATIAAAGLVAAACGPKPIASSGPVAPISVQQPAPQKIAAVQAAAPAPAAALAAPVPGPNLLAKTWPERLGIIVSQLTPATGRAI